MPSNTAVFDYVAEAQQTLSPSFHPRKVSVYGFTQRLRYFVLTTEALDADKKSLFYGKGEDVVEGGEEMLRDISESTSSTNLLHGMLGIATEAGELIEQALILIDDPMEIDATNVAEEMGDLFWYMAILANELGVSFEQIQRRNIAKLRHRFPNKFTEYDAANRDLVGEREILETGVAMQTHGK